MWDKCKAKVGWAFRHRTKIAGAIGIVCGSIENWLDNHDRLPLWLMRERGVLLMGFGAVVTGIGIYNSLANWFGWKDDP